MDTVIIAIDGQASTGKSTQAKKLAQNLNYDYRDSGAYYRAITLYLLDNDIKFDLNIPDKILDKINIKQTYEQGQFSIYLNDDDVTERIRGHKVSLNVSNYAKKQKLESLFLIN